MINYFTQNTKPWRLLVSLIVVFLGSSLSAHADVNLQLPVQKWVSRSGIPVWFLPAHELPMVDIKILVDAGAVRDGGQPGIAFTTSYLLNDGCAGLSQSQVAKGFEQVGAEFSSSAHVDGAQVGLRTLTESQYLQPALKLMHACLTKPQFAQTGLSRFQEEMTLGFKQLKHNPVVQGVKLYRQHMYPNHPYGHYFKGNSSSINQLTRDDIRHFYQRYFTQKNIKIVIVGHLSLAQAKSIVEQLTKDMPVGKKAAKIPPPPKVTPPKHLRLEMPLKQTTIILAHPGVANNFEKWPNLLLANEVLGGGMTSRLFTAVREKKGYVYSIQSAFARRRLAGSFFVLLKSRNEVAQKASDLAMATILDYLHKGPNQKELEAAKKIISNNFIGSYSSNSSKLNQLTGLLANDEKLEKLTAFLPKISSATLPKVMQTLSGTLTRKNWTVIEIGPKKTE